MLYVGMPHGVQEKSRLPIRNSGKKGDMLKRQPALRFERMARNKRRVRATHEVLLVGRFVVGVSGREHHALNAEVHHLVKECANAVGIGAVKQSGVGGHAEAALQVFLDAFKRQLISTFAANRKVVMFALSVPVSRECQILARLKE